MLSTHGFSLRFPNGGSYSFTSARERKRKQREMVSRGRWTFGNRRGCKTQTEWKRNTLKTCRRGGKTLVMIITFLPSGVTELKGSPPTRLGLCVGSPLPPPLTEQPNPGLLVRKSLAAANAATTSTQGEESKKRLGAEDEVGNCGSKPFILPPPPTNQIPLCSRKGSFFFTVKEATPVSNPAVKRPTHIYKQ